MSETGSVSAGGGYIETGGLGKFIPEPKSRLDGAFEKVLGGAMRGAAGILDSVIPGGGALGDAGYYQQLLAEQIRMQMLMQQVSMASNISKSEHEASMAVVRNVRTS